MAEDCGQALQLDAGLQQFNRIDVPEAVGMPVPEIRVGNQFLKASLPAGNGCLQLAIATPEPVTQICLRCCFKFSNDEVRNRAVRMHACLLRVLPDFVIYEALYNTAPGVAGALREEIVGTEVWEAKALELKREFITVEGKQGIDNCVKVLKSILPVMVQSLPAAAVPKLIAAFARETGLFGAHVLNVSRISKLGLSVVDGQVVDRRLNLRCSLEANPQLRGEHSDIRFEENLFMTAGEFMGFRAAREQFAPPEIRIAAGQDWPILA